MPEFPYFFSDLLIIVGLTAFVILVSVLLGWTFGRHTIKIEPGFVIKEKVVRSNGKPKPEPEGDYINDELEGIPTL